MSKAIKLQDDNYLDSSAIVHNRVPLNEILDDVYSTEEVKTNKIWIDGKPIYRKVIVKKQTVAKQTSLTNIVIDHNIPNIDMALTCKTITDSGAIMPYIGSSQGLSSVIRFTQTQITFRYYNDYFAEMNWYFVCEYTKLTD